MLTYQFFQHFSPEDARTFGYTLLDVLGEWQGRSPSDIEDRLAIVLEQRELFEDVHDPRDAIWFEAQILGLTTCLRAAVDPIY